MTIKPGFWIGLAQLLTVVNVGAVYFAAQSAEPWHAVLHAGLAVAFTVWSDWLRARAGRA